MTNVFCALSFLLHFLLSLRFVDPIVIGDPCFLVNSCQAVDHSRCARPSYRCECVDGYFPDLRNTSCTPCKYIMGGVMGRGRTVDHSRCARPSYRCECIDGYFPDLRNTSCTPCKYMYLMGGVMGRGGVGQWIAVGVRGPATDASV